MSTGAAIVAVASVALVTYSMRAGVILLLAGRTLPAAVERALRQVGPAVLAALAINLMFGGEGGPMVTLPEVAGLVAAAGVAWWRRNLLWSLAAGMTALLALDAVV